MVQRSGQPSYATDVLAFLGAGRPEIRQALREVRPVSSFRSRFAYVNNHWLVSAQVVESITPNGDNTPKPPPGKHPRPPGTPTPKTLDVSL